MKIYNEDKTKELTLEECDLSRGELIECEEVIIHEAVESIEEQGHYEVVREYENGGKDVEWIIDVPGLDGHPAYEETISYQKYIPYSDSMLLHKEYTQVVEELKIRLAETDFQAIKYAEGLYTEDQYIPIREQRQRWRDAINDYNEKIRALGENE